MVAMKLSNRIFLLVFIFISSAFSNILLAQQNSIRQYISSISPLSNAIDVSAVTNIMIIFDSTMDAASLNDHTFFTFGSQSGFHAGIISYDTINRTVTFDPSTDFFKGEVVTTILTTNVRTSAGTNLPSGFSWSFTIGVSSGSGFFQKDTDYGTNGSVQSIYGGDLDNDGDIDLAGAIVANSNNLIILLNNGAGIFKKEQLLKVGDTPRSVSGGDFDQDGDIDLVTANTASNGISILLNKGNGSFELSDTYDFNENPFFVVVSDVNNDGYIDIATANRETNSVSILLNKNDGTFVVNGKYGVSPSPRSLTSGDFNLDGSMDLAITELESNEISILINNGDGTFQLANVYRAGSTNSNPHFISAADINGDYNLDLIVTNRGVDSVLILKNRGDGSFFPGSSYEVGDEPRSLYLGDFDYDIDLDMVTANFSANDIFVHLNNGAGEFLIDSTYITGNSPRFVFGGDVDNDGDIDLAVANFDDKTISIFKNENSIQTNYPPETPLLIMPQPGSFISESKPNLVWQVPADRNGDNLHFRLEFNRDSTWIFDSLIDPLGFNPSPPVRQGVGSVSYLLQQNLPDGRYEWRVAARDQNTFGEFSSEWLFTVDTTPPMIDSLVISSPYFFPNWYNQNHTPMIELLVYYDEIHASFAKLDTGMPNGFSVKDSIQGGFNQMVKFFIDIATAEDGAYWIVSVIQDSANNTTRDSLQVQLDSTPPTSITATSFVNTSASTSFIITWQNATDSGSGVSGYDIRVKVDNKEWQDLFINSPVTATVYTGENRHLYSFEVRARDNVGNVEPFTGFAEAQVYVDTAWIDLTAPSAPLNLTAGGANPSPWQKNHIFGINWSNPLDPSGIRRSRYKLGTAPKSNNDTTGTAKGIPPFEVVTTQENGQELYLWLEDGHGNVDFRNHSRVTMRYDATPPVIDSLVALAPDFPPNCYNQDFTGVVKIRIYYDEAHAAGATLATGGLGDPNELGTIPSGVMQAVDFNVDVTNDPDGNYQLLATVSDSAGNQRLSSPFIIKLDATPPVIAHIPQILVNEDLPIIISSVVNDNNRIHHARLYYRKGGDSTYSSEPMNSQDDTTFQAAIPGRVVGSRGVDYFLMATDGLNVSHSPSVNWEAFPHHIQVRVIGKNNQGLLNDSIQLSGSEQKAFRMISVPIIIDNPKPDAVLEDDLGPYDRKKWRFFHYNTQSGTYDEFPDTDGFSPGKAFWLIIKDSDKIIDSGIGTSVPSDTPFVIPLQQGWNDIANPFNFAIDWNIISVGLGNFQDIMGPYTYEDRWLIPSEIVKILPWKGYSVYTEHNDISLIIPPVESSQGLNKSLWDSFSDIQWQIILEVTCQHAQDVANVIGCAGDASEEWDNRDYLEPPPIGSHISLFFPHDNWKRFPGCYTTDFRPDFNIGETWDFGVKTNIENSDVKLRILNTRTIPSRFKVMVYDISGYQKMNITDTSFYSFKSHRNLSVRSFKLVIGIPEFVNEVEGEIPLAPDNFHLAQNFPNPFNPGTQIQYQLPQRISVNLKIYNLIGQKIKTLISEEQDPGYYQIYWNGKDDYNREVGTGIYILRMKAGNFVQTKKMILTK
jgi:hypothetical protein